MFRTRMTSAGSLDSQWRRWLTRLTWMSNSSSPDRLSIELTIRQDKRCLIASTTREKFHYRHKRLTTISTQIATTATLNYLLAPLIRSFKTTTGLKSNMPTSPSRKSLTTIRHTSISMQETCINVTAAIDTTSANTLTEFIRICMPRARDVTTKQISNNGLDAVLTYTCMTTNIAHSSCQTSTWNKITAVQATVLNLNRQTTATRHLHIHFERERVNRVHQDVFYQASKWTKSNASSLSPNSH